MLTAFAIPRGIRWGNYPDLTAHSFRVRRRVAGDERRVGLDHHLQERQIVGVRQFGRQQAGRDSFAAIG